MSLDKWTSVAHRDSMVVVDVGTQIPIISRISTISIVSNNFERTKTHNKE
jgi:hypothetical protein